MKNIAASIRQRLLNQARARGEEFERTLVRYADERLLYRLGASGVRERCILKGASLLTAWMRDPYRATRDVDLLAMGSATDDAIRAIVEEICALPCPEDGLVFDAGKLIVEDIRPNDKYVGKRARFFARLGPARIRVQIDFGVGDVLTTQPLDIDYPTMLDGIPAPRVRAYPREASVAEKFESMVALGTSNSRMKDFHDVWALSGTFDFDGPALRHAVEACFERRGRAWTAEVAAVLAPSFYLRPQLQENWRSYVSGDGVLVTPPAQFELIGERISLFLAPVTQSIMATTPFASSWPAAGPWSRT